MQRDGADGERGGEDVRGEEVRVIPRGDVRDDSDGLELDRLDDTRVLADDARSKPRGGALVHAEGVEGETRELGRAATRREHLRPRLREWFSHLRRHLERRGVRLAAEKLGVPLDARDALAHRRLAPTRLRLCRPDELSHQREVIVRGDRGCDGPGVRIHRVHARRERRAPNGEQRGATHGCVSTV